MKDLAPRVAVAAVGIPAVAALLYAGGWVLGVPLALLAAVAAAETFRMAACRGVRAFAWIGYVAAAGLTLAAVALPDFTAFAPAALAGLAGLALLLLAVALVARGVDEAPLGAVAVTFFGAAYAALPLASLALLHALPEVRGWGPLSPFPWAGAAVVALPLAATWVGDSAAYFAGSAWGRKRLAPSISPGKSWVGAWAGVAGASLAGGAWWWVVRDLVPGVPVPGLGVALGLGAVLGVGAIVGDLAESLLKREAGVKDSGALFPGHGGALDRLDALVFTLPLAYGLLVWLGRAP